MTEKLDVPFNVRLLSLTPKKLSGLKPVRVLDIFDGATGNLHEDGLFSISIFGKPGDERRSLRFSYIDIKIPILHPIIYFALTDLKKLYGLVMEGKEYAIWNPLLHDFERSNPVEGQTGYNFFISHWDEIEFKPSKSDLRIDQVKLINTYKSIALTDKIVVIPAGLRDVEITDDGRVRKDEINDFYTTFLSVANAISDVATKTNPELLDNARYKLQANFNGLYNALENMIKGKRKLFLSKWATRRIQNGTRNVITAMKLDNKVLGAKGNINYNSTIVGLYQAMKAALPISKYHIKNGYIANLFLSPDLPVRLVDPKTLKAVEERIDIRYFDRWTTDEGLDKLITSFSESSIRHEPIMVDDKYLALIYKGKGKDNTYKLFQDIDELPVGLDKSLVEPISLAELFYVSVEHALNKLPAFVTRYPITGVGSIYPSITYVKSTVKGEARRPLDESWQPMDDESVCFQFPIKGLPFFDSLSPHSSKLSGLSAD